MVAEMMENSREWQKSWKIIGNCGIYKKQKNWVGIDMEFN